MPVTLTDCATNHCGTGVKIVGPVDVNISRHSASECEIGILICDGEIHLPGPEGVVRFLLPSDVSREDIEDLSKRALSAREDGKDAYSIVSGSPAWVRMLEVGANAATLLQCLFEVAKLLR